MHSLFVFYDGWALLVLRFVLGAVFLEHGWPKMKDLKKNAEGFDSMGFKPGFVFGTIAALLEFFGGIALMLGFFTSIVAGFFILQFIVILTWRIKSGHKFVGGWELDLLVLGAVIVLFSLGAGQYSLDRMVLGML